MYIGVYINDCLHFRSKSIDECFASAIEFLNKRWKSLNCDVENDLQEKSDAGAFVKAIREVTTLYETKFDKYSIRIKEIDEKKYLVTYTRTYEECEETSDCEILSTQIRQVCYEHYLNELWDNMRRNAESDAVAKQDNHYIGVCLSNGTIDCLQDDENVYELYSHTKHERYVVEIKELD